MVQNFKIGILSFSENETVQQYFYYVFYPVSEIKGVILKIMLLVDLSKKDLCNQIYRLFFIDHNFYARDQF